MKTLYVVDGSNLIYRGYYSSHSYSRKDKDGNCINGLYGFFSLLLKDVKLVKQYFNSNIDYFCVLFDIYPATNRRNIYPQYKLNRKDNPDRHNIKRQMKIAKKLLESLGIDVLYNTNGNEADDLIASLALNFKGKVVISTTDKDLCQVVRKNISILRKDEFITNKNFYSIYGIKPNQFKDYLCLMGDNSDNIPGIYGVGKVKAKKIINEIGSISSFFDNVVDNRWYSDILIQSKDILDLGAKLISLNIDPTISIQELSGIKVTARSLFDHYNLLSFVDPFSIVLYE